MEVTVLANAGARHQITHAKWFAEGLNAIGHTAVTHCAPRSVRTKVVACWGWRVGRNLRNSGHEVIVLERGYLGDRFKWTSIGLNGLNGRATFFGKDDDSRFKNNFNLRPWRNTLGDYVLLLGQVPGDASLNGVDLTSWYSKAATQASLAYELPIMFRPHPMAHNRQNYFNPKEVKISTGSLEEALENAHVAIAWNSNAAVDAVVAGVPAVVMDQGSMAWDVAGHNIGDLEKPDRNLWAANLAWCQWSEEEIRSGVALVGLMEFLDGK